jgi:hypothetical protein
MRHAEELLASGQYGRAASKFNEAMGQVKPGSNGYSAAIELRNVSRALLRNGDNITSMQSVIKQHAQTHLLLKALTKKP